MGGGEVTIGQRASWDPMLVGVGAAVSQSRARPGKRYVGSRKTRGWQLFDRQKALESPECASARPNRGQVLSTRSPGPHVKGWKVPRVGHKQGLGSQGRGQNASFEEGQSLRHCTLPSADSALGDQDWRRMCSEHSAKYLR